MQPEAIAVGLDLTDRETQSQLRISQLPWSKVKCFKGSGVIGGLHPFTGDFDEICNGKFSLKLLVNGELRQSANLSSMSIYPSQQMTSLQSWAPVMAGDFLVNEAKKYGAQIIPIDSEHCSIHQSIQGKKENSISKITLTCSGGPFYNLTKSKFKLTVLRQLNLQLIKILSADLKKD